MLIQTEFTSQAPDFVAPVLLIQTKDVAGHQHSGVTPNWSYFDGEVS